MFTSLRDRSVAASASTRIAGAVPRRHINDRRKPADSRRIDRVDSRNRELIPSGSGMTSLTAAHALSLSCVLSFLCLSVSSTITDLISRRWRPTGSQISKLKLASALAGHRRATRRVSRRKFRIAIEIAWRCAPDRQRQVVQRCAARWFGSIRSIDAM